jgi:hypothetical protein
MNRAFLGRAIHYLAAEAAAPALRQLSTAAFGGVGRKP